MAVDLSVNDSVNTNSKGRLDLTYFDPVPFACCSSRFDKFLVYPV